MRKCMRELFSQATHVNKKKTAEQVFGFRNISGTFRGIFSDFPGGGILNRSSGPGRLRVLADGGLSLDAGLSLHVAVFPTLRTPPAYGLPPCPPWHVFPPSATQPIVATSAPDLGQLAEPRLPHPPSDGGCVAGVLSLVVQGISH